MSFTVSEEGFVAGEISPSVWGRTTLPKYKLGTSTCRNFFVDFQGGASTRAGLAYIGNCLEAGTNTSPPRLIPFQFNINQGYALEFGDGDIIRNVFNVTNNGSGLIRITTGSTGRLFTGATVVINGIGGTTEANGTWLITIINDTQFDLVGSAFVNAYTSGGTVTTHQYMRILLNGSYVTETPLNITGATQANPAVLTIPAHGFHVGDSLFIFGMGGMTNFNGLTWIVNTVPTVNTLTLKSLFGNVVNSTGFSAYTSGGTAARIFTIASPYATTDIPYLKYTQSADTMTLCCVNQLTSVEYPSYELQRSGATSWTFTQDTFASAISAPTGVTVTPKHSTTQDTYYSYVVTAVNANGEESVASTAGSAQNNDIAVFAGSNTITWNAVTGATSYNVYKATPSFTDPVPVGVLYGYMTTVFGTSATDKNITADFNTVPPVHNNPFARSPILAVNPTAGGSGYTTATIGYTITTTTGSGFAGTPVVVGGAFSSFVITNGGQGYKNTDTITITDGGGGTGATATLTIGQATGTYPGVPAYFQQRRVYAYSLDFPDTYWMSKPGYFNNMDSSVPVNAADAITGSPWAQQINGIQFLVPMPNGLVTFTGLQAWQLNGGNSIAITPSNQTAIAQASTGCSDTVPPIQITSLILFVQAKDSVVRSLEYSFLTNIYSGTDITILSDHLFNNHTIIQWGYSEEPFKIVWAVRDDGILLSMTWLKEQDVYGWARHDTNGLVKSLCIVTEPTTTGYIDAVYVIVKRYVQGQWLYYTERMNNRDWTSVEECFCVDSGLSYPMSSPNAILTPAAADGTDNITGTIVVQGGSGYTHAAASALSPDGKGTGATFTVTISGGVITAVTPVTTGQGYIGGTTIAISGDGSGAIVVPLVTNYVIFSASANVFSPSNVGDVIRGGGGKAQIVTYTSPTQVTANILTPITSVLQNDEDSTPIPFNSGQWTLSTPTTVVSGLNHLEGKTVSILADGSVEEQQTVTNGQITLEESASEINVGLGYTCQLQTLFLDPAAQDSSQGKRKNIGSLVIRHQDTRGIFAGSNQPDASANNGVNIPWSGLVPVKQRGPLNPPGTALPLLTDDSYTNIPQDWSEKGQVAIEVRDPVPATINALFQQVTLGDTGR